MFKKRPSGMHSEVLHAGAAGAAAGSCCVPRLFEQVLTRLASRKKLREDMGSEAIQLPQGSLAQRNIHIYIYIKTNN